MKYQIFKLDYCMLSPKDILNASTLEEAKKEANDKKVSYPFTIQEAKECAYIPTTAQEVEKIREQCEYVAENKNNIAHYIVK